MALFKNKTSSLNLVNNLTRLRRISCFGSIRFFQIYKYFTYTVALTLSEEDPY